jgi:hypothetical protein
MDQNSPKQKTPLDLGKFSQGRRHNAVTSLNSLTREPSGMAGMKKTRRTLPYAKPQKNALLHL